MAIDSNSYGSLSEVAALTRMYLTGESTFNSTTRPTGTEVETYIDRASSVLNVALANEGFTVPVSQADAKRACAQWVVEQVVRMVSIFRTQPEEAAYWLSNMHANAAEFVEMNEMGFKNIGAGVNDAEGRGAVFTGETAQADRSDPDNTALEQPMFIRRQFDN